MTATKDAEKAEGPAQEEEGEMGSSSTRYPMANALADDSDGDELTGGLLLNKSTALTADKDADSIR